MTLRARRSEICFVLQVKVSQRRVKVPANVFDVGIDRGNPTKELKFRSEDAMEKTSFRM
jgi:hypothetical protein